MSCFWFRGRALKPSAYTCTTAASSTRSSRYLRTAVSVNRGSVTAGVGLERIDSAYPKDAGALEYAHASNSGGRADGPARRCRHAGPGQIADTGRYLWIERSKAIQRQGVGLPQLARQSLARRQTLFVAG